LHNSTHARAYTHTHTNTHVHMQGCWQAGRKSVRLLSRSLDTRPCLRLCQSCVNEGRSTRNFSAAKYQIYLGFGLRLATLKHVRIEAHFLLPYLYKIVGDWRMLPTRVLSMCSWSFIVLFLRSHMLTQFHFFLHIPSKEVILVLSDSLIDDPEVTLRLLCQKVIWRSS
jgi:hypothetical protein